MGGISQNVFFLVNDCIRVSICLFAHFNPFQPERVIHTQNIHCNTTSHGIQLKQWDFWICAPPRQDTPFFVHKTERFPVYFVKLLSMFLFFIFSVRSWVGGRAPGTPSPIQCLCDTLPPPRPPRLSCPPSPALIPKWATHRCVRAVALCFVPGDGVAGISPRVRALGTPLEQSKNSRPIFPQTAIPFFLFEYRTFGAALEERFWRPSARLQSFLFKPEGTLRGGGEAAAASWALNDTPKWSF